VINDRARAVSLAAAAAIAMGFTYTDQAAIVPLLRAELNLSESQVGLFPSALFATAVLTMIAMGGLPDRAGAKRVTAIGFAVATLGHALFAFAPSYETLLASKAIAGIGNGAAFVSGVRYVTGAYGGQRSHLGQGLFGAGYPLGSALGLALMPPLAIAFGGWRGAFLASTALIAVVLVAYAVFAPAVPKIPTRANIALALANANARWCFVQHAAGFGLSLATATWASVFVLHEFGVSIVAAGVLGSFLLLMGPPMRVLGGYLVASERLSTIATMRGSQLSNLAGLVLIALPGRPLAVALAGFALLGIGVSLPYAAVFNTAAASLPNAPGAAQSLTAAGGTLGAVLGAPLMGVVAERIGFAEAWLAIAAIPLVALVGTFVMRGEESLAASAS